MTSWTFSGRTLTLKSGDLTRCDADAIVNAANSRLAGGGGVDGAIHRAAGLSDLQAECRSIIARIGSLPAGEAVITPGFALPARHIIHTVGPIWKGGNEQEPELLAQAYNACLELAHANKLSSIAFPAISCGSYGFPVQLAVPISLMQLRCGLERGLVREVRVVLHGPEAMDIWTRSAKRLFAAHTAA